MEPGPIPAWAVTPTICRGLDRNVTPVTAGGEIVSRDLEVSTGFRYAVCCILKQEAAMPETPSTMAPLGMKAPKFRLPEVVSGRTVSLDDYKSAPALLVMFICNHCPYVRHVREHLAQLVREYQARGVAVVGISSNDAAQFPEDGPEGMKEEARTVGYTFPYLFDQTQDVAKEYRAACTPDFFVFDKDRRLV